MYTTLISAEQLKALQTSGQPLMVFDCSFELMRPLEGEQQYLQTHIAGAVRADMDRHLSAHPVRPELTSSVRPELTSSVRPELTSSVRPELVEGLAGASTGSARTGRSSVRTGRTSGRTDVPASGGRHPLPSRDSFAAWLASLGFAAGMQAVVYDRQGSGYCGRLWWMLKWVGHEAVAVLDGGLQAWQAAGGTVSAGPATPRAASSFRASTEKARLASSASVLQQLGRPGQTLVDARGAPRFRGEVEPLDPVAGHIPGALNRPFGDNFAADGKFKPAAQLKAEFLELLAGRDPASAVHSCGSGVSAVPNLLAMEVAGLGRTALYAGSWSEWCSDASRPVAKG